MKVKQYSYGLFLCFGNKKILSCVQIYTIYYYWQLWISNSLYPKYGMQCDCFNETVKMTAFLCMWWLKLIYWCISTVLFHISDLFVLCKVNWVLHGFNAKYWTEILHGFNAKYQTEMLYLEAKPSKLSAYTETAISHVSSTSFTVLYLTHLRLAGWL